MRLLKGSAGRNGAPRPSAPSHRSLRRQALWDGEGIRALGFSRDGCPPPPPLPELSSRGRSGCARKEGGRPGEPGRPLAWIAGPGPAVAVAAGRSGLWPPRGRCGALAAAPSHLGVS